MIFGDGVLGTGTLIIKKHSIYVCTYLGDVSEFRTAKR